MFSRMRLQFYVNTLVIVIIILNLVNRSSTHTRWCACSYLQFSGHAFFGSSWSRLLVYLFFSRIHILFLNIFLFLSLTLVYPLEGLGIHLQTTTNCGKRTTLFSLAYQTRVPTARLYPVRVLLCRIARIQYSMIPIWTGKRFSTISVQVILLYASIIDVICTHELIIVPSKHGWIIVTTEYINWSSASNRAICQQCRSIIWLSSLTCASPHHCPKNGKDEVKVVPLLPYAVSASTLWSIVCEFKR
jgi:hypothetical protein